MPQFAIDDAEKPSSWTALSSAAGPMTLARGPGLLNLKRGRTMEPRVSSPPCMMKCCAEIKDHSATSLAELCLCPSRGTPQDHKNNSDSCIGLDDQGYPEDEFDDFDLGPPPPCGPVLVRQNAMDMTASAEAKFAIAAGKVETVPVTVMMPSRGTAVMMAAPRFLRTSRPSMN